MKECFIAKDGVERKADLDDIIPWINEGRELQHIIKNIKDIDLAAALAHLSEENKDKIYRNMSPRISGELKKNIGIAESKYEKDYNFIQIQKTRLIEFFCQNNGIWQKDLSDFIVWRDTKQENTEMSNISRDPIKNLIIRVEHACYSGHLNITSYEIKDITEEDIQKVFTTFTNRSDELRKIRSLEIPRKVLYAAALLFEEGTIETLNIRDHDSIYYPWPSFLEKYTALTSIEIFCPLAEFPVWIRNSVSLRHLYIRMSGISYIPEWIGDIQSLTELSLGEIDEEEGNLKTFPESICNLKNLVKLEFNDTSIEKLPDSIGDLQSLKELSLMYNKYLKYIPDTIGNLENLAKLVLHHTSIEKLPDSIGNLQSLTELSLCSIQSMKCIPDSIGNLKNLTKLYFFEVPIEKLPDSIGNLLSLTELTLSNDKKLKSVPDSICNLKNLVKLEFNDTSIGKLPENIGDLQLLTEFSFGYNKNFKNLPDSIGNLKNLVNLYLDELFIEKLPDSIGNLQSLKELSLDFNEKLENLPDSIGNLKNLVELELWETPIAKLPDSICNLKNLVRLELKNTFIRKLPDNIGSLYSLEELSLICNKNLKSIPDSICNLKNLSELELRETPIEKLPDTIELCKALEYVNISGTNITSVPCSISSLKKFFKSNQWFPSQEQYVSYRSFCNYYYTIIERIFWFKKLALKEGYHAFWDYLDRYSDDFLNIYMYCALGGYDTAYTRHILTLEIEHEHDFYRKILMEIIMEGILCIQQGHSIPYTAFTLASLVNIKNNPLDAACAKYLEGNCEAFENIDFKAAIIQEEECEEVRFIKRFIFLSRTVDKEGLLALEKYLDYDGITKRDIFEYALPLVIDQLDIPIIDTILDRLIAHESNPMLKNLALAKKEAVISLCKKDNAYIAVDKLCAYFDINIKKIIWKYWNLLDD
jgi:Leucine-rich repeat (LRR) protein